MASSSALEDSPPTKIIKKSYVTEMATIVEAEKLGLYPDEGEGARERADAKTRMVSALEQRCVEKRVEGRR